MANMIEAFVIKLQGVSSSEDLAKECRLSGSKFNLEIKNFNGIYGKNNIDAAHQIFGIRPWKDKMKKNRLGVKGCFLSHYSLWKESLTKDKPIAIFEHDAVMLRPLPTNILKQFKEFLMLDPYNKMKGSYESNHLDESKIGVEEYFNNDSNPKYGVTDQYVMGLQAYIIKPEAAEKLIKNVKKNGYLPADIQCHKGLINIQTIYPSVASINPKFWNNKRLMKEESTTHKEW